MNYCGTPLLSITSNINLLACSVFCVYSNTTGLKDTQQHKELTSHDPLMTINAVRRRWGCLEMGQSIRCPAEPSQSPTHPTAKHPSLTTQGCFLLYYVNRAYIFNYQAIAGIQISSTSFVAGCMNHEVLLTLHE